MSEPIENSPNTLSTPPTTAPETRDEEPSIVVPVTRQLGDAPVDLQQQLTQTASMTQEGEVGRIERYPVFGELGRGGMGVVLRGRDARLGRDLAIKVLLGDHAQRPDVVQRFEEESRSSREFCFGRTASISRRRIAERLW